MIESGSSASHQAVGVKCCLAETEEKQDRERKDKEHNLLCAECKHELQQD